MARPIDFLPVSPLLLQILDKFKNGREDARYFYGKMPKAHRQNVFRWCLAHLNESNERITALAVLCFETGARIRSIELELMKMAVLQSALQAFDDQLVSVFDSYLKAFFAAAPLLRRYHITSIEDLTEKQRIHYIYVFTKVFFEALRKHSDELPAKERALIRFIDFQLRSIEVKYS